MNQIKSIPRLQFITGSSHKVSHAEEARQACEGGIRFVQFREKHATLEQCKRMAETTKLVCQSYGASLVVDDFIEVAREIGADGVHLGYEDESPEKARSILGEKAIVGGTANNIDHVKTLAPQGVDYLGVGPYRFTSNKEKLKPILGVSGYQQLMAEMEAMDLDIPVLAIGGIQPDDVPDLLKTGVHGIAVASAIANETNPVEAAQAFLDKMG